MRRITPAAFVALALTALSAAPAPAQEASLGGGSDIPAGTVIEVPAGITIPPVHHVFADNSEAQDIEVEFRAEAPPGVEIVAERSRFPIAPGESVRVPFSIQVGDVVPTGDHPVTVQLVRSDIVADPGQVTNIPAVGTNFILRVVGEAATITIQARSEQSGQPVTGTLTLAAVTGPAATFEVARAEGADLSARVAPGPYRAAYLLAGRELASADLDVAAGTTEEIVLEVRTVSFVLVAATPVEEDGKVVVAELVASVENHLQPIDGPITIRAVVHRDGQQTDTITLDNLGGLDLGVTETNLTYRPPDGFAAGSYRFEFELQTDQFTLQASDEPTFDVGAGSSSNSLAIAIGAIVGAGAPGARGWALRSRVRRHRRRSERAVGRDSRSARHFRDSTSSQRREP